MARTGMRRAPAIYNNPLMSRTPYVVSVGLEDLSTFKSGLDGLGTVLVRVSASWRGSAENREPVPTWYWLRREGGRWTQDYEDMGEWRSEGEGGGRRGAMAGRLEAGPEGGGWWSGKLTVSVTGGGCLVYPVFKGYDERGDDVLPLMVESDLVVLNDGKEVVWEVKARVKVMMIEVEGWAGGGGVVHLDG